MYLLVNPHNFPPTKLCKIKENKEEAEAQHKIENKIKTKTLQNLLWENVKIDPNLIIIGTT